MKVSKQQASENREAIVQVAAAQIREQGFDQMSVAAVAKAAGLTHGALYSHFGSKEALQAAAIERAYEECAAGFSGLTPEQFIDRYLSPEHRDNPGQGCPTAALVSEVRCQSEDSRSAFHDGIIRFAALTSDSLVSGGADETQEVPLFAFAAMVGGLAIARAIRDLDEAGSDAVLRAVAEQLQQVVAGAPRPALPVEASTPAAPAGPHRPRARRNV